MVTEDPDRRPFSVFDAMLLVAATAPGLVLLRIADDLELFSNEQNNPWGYQFLEYMSVAGGCVLVPLAIAVLTISLFDSRTSRGEVIQGAGFISCLSVRLLSKHLPISSCGSQLPANWTCRSLRRSNSTISAGV